MIRKVSRGKRSGAVEGEGEEGLGDAVGVVAEEVAFEGEVAGDGFDAEGADAVEVGLDGGLASAGVAFEQRGRDGGGVDEGVVEERGAANRSAPFAIGSSAGGFFRCAGMR